MHLFLILDICAYCVVRRNVAIINHCRAAMSETLIPLNPKKITHIVALGLMSFKNFLLLLEVEKRKRRWSKVLESN